MTLSHDDSTINIDRSYYYYYYYYHYSTLDRIVGLIHCIASTGAMPCILVRCALNVCPGSKAFITVYLYLERKSALSGTSVLSLYKGALCVCVCMYDVSL